MKVKYDSIWPDQLPCLRAVWYLPFSWMLIEELDRNVEDFGLRPFKVHGHEGPGGRGYTPEN